MAFGGSNTPQLIRIANRGLLDVLDENVIALKNSLMQLAVPEIEKGDCSWEQQLPSRIKISSEPRKLRNFSYSKFEYGSY